MQLAAAAGLDPYKAHTFSAAQIQAGLNDHLVGRERTPHEMFAPGLKWCSRPSQHLAECFVPFSESWLLEKGYLVTFQLGKGGSLRSAEVRPHWQSSP